MKIENFNSEAKWIKAVLSFIKSINPHVVALSGGETPRQIYRALSEHIPDNNFEFYQVDERYVPANHQDSNYKMIEETFKKPCYHFDTSLSINNALKNYAERIKMLPSYPNYTFDLCILGIGPDGHTASLFPHPLFPHSNKIDEPVIHTTTNQFAIKDRLTITFSTILKSKTLLVLLKNKADILAELQNPTKSPEEFPALHLLKHPNLHVFNL